MVKAELKEASCAHGGWELCKRSFFTVDHRLYPGG